MNSNPSSVVCCQACDPSARLMYEAEVALHAARQTGVDEWVRAACDKLHDAIARHLGSHAAAS